MIFMHTADRVLSGAKTQTRRLAKPGDVALNYWRNPCQNGLYHPGSIDHIGVVQRNKRDLWLVTRTYAVQPARTAKGIARIQLTGIRREDVRQISEADAVAEGFGSPELFWLTWTAMYDPLAALQVKCFIEAVPDVVNGVTFPGFRVMKPTEDRELYYYTARDYLAQRPAHRYAAWVLTFALVPESTR